MSFTGKPELTNDATVINDGFWIDVSTGELMTTYRIPGEYDDDTIYQELIDAVIRVNEKLSAVKDAMVLANFNFDTDAKINNQSVCEHQYKKAVYCFAKAKLLKQFETQNRRAEAENQAKESTETYQHWLNQAMEGMAFLQRKFIGTAHSENYGVYFSML
jgi:hypothetical protein